MGKGYIKYKFIFNKFILNISFTHQTNRDREGGMIKVLTSLAINKKGKDYKGWMARRIKCKSTLCVYIYCHSALVSIKKIFYIILL